MTKDSYLVAEFLGLHGPELDLLVLLVVDLKGVAVELGVTPPGMRLIHVETDKILLGKLKIH